MDIFNDTLTALSSVAPFAMFFACLALLVKGKAFILDVKRAFPEWRTNIAIFVVDTLLVMPYVILPSAWIVVYIGVFAPTAHLLSEMSVALSCILAVIVGDYIGYWRHRLEHSTLLWPVHATHHSDREMNWFSLNRMHPLNRLTTVTIDVSVLTLLGFPIWAVIANNFIRNAWGYFIHADVPWSLGPLGAFLISPSAHRWHHVRRMDMAGRNFATVFTFWDKMHGTYYSAPTPCREPTGVEGHSGGFIFEMLFPFRAFFKALRRHRG